MNESGIPSHWKAVCLEMMDSEIARPYFSWKNKQKAINNMPQPVKELFLDVFGMNGLWFDDFESAFSEFGDCYKRFELDVSWSKSKKKQITRFKKVFIYKSSQLQKAEEETVTVLPKYSIDLCENIMKEAKGCDLEFGQGSWKDKQEAVNQMPNEVKALFVEARYINHAISEKIIRRANILNWVSEFDKFKDNSGESFKLSRKIAKCTFEHVFEPSGKLVVRENSLGENTVLGYEVFYAKGFVMHLDEK